MTGYIGDTAYRPGTGPVASVVAVDEPPGHTGEWFTPSGQTGRTPVRVRRNGRVVHRTYVEAMKAAQAALDNYGKDKP